MNLNFSLRFVIFKKKSQILLLATTLLKVLELLNLKISLLFLSTESEF